MALTNNAVRVSAGLACNLTTPNLGGSTVATIGFTDGDVAQDKLVSLSSSPTALNADLDGDGFLLISNPGPLAILIKLASTTLGNIPPGTASAPFGVIIPVADGVIINATCASAQTIGATLIKVTANA